MHGFSLATIIVSLLGAYIFARGFLLVRVEVIGTRTCHDGILPSSSLGAGLCSPLASDGGGSMIGNKECWTHPLFARTVVVIVDALRWDFASSKECWGSLNHDGTPHSSYHCDAMPLLSSRLSTHPNHTSLFLASVDAPTVTMQRIKAITTGGLPTFIDASSNFATFGASIREDSWISQISHAAPVNNLSGAAFWGDDTWLALFPKEENGMPWVHGAVPESSFDTRDLDSADIHSSAGLLESLYTRPLPNWRIGILHTLGIDHAGHTFGADSEQMRRKLTDADNLINKVTLALEAASLIDDAPSLLLIIGDHGMTEDGNHGGAERNEASAALIAMSFGRPLLLQSDDYNNTTSKTAAQIDVAPTLSLALGLPIPAASLGTMLSGFEWDPLVRGGVWSARASARASGFAALAVYNTLITALPSIEINTLSIMITEATTKLADAEMLAGNDCEWAQRLLDSVKPTTNDIALILAFNDAGIAFDRAAQVVADRARIQWAKFDEKAMMYGVSLLMIALAFATFDILRGGILSEPSLIACILLSLFILRIAALFSNSFITEEPAVLRFLCHTAVLFVAIVTVFDSSSLKRQTNKRHFHHSITTSRIILFAAISFCICGLAIEAPPVGWLHYWRGGGGGAGGGVGGGTTSMSLGNDLDPTTLARLTAGAGARGAILLPVSAGTSSGAPLGTALFSVTVIAPIVRILLCHFLPKIISQIISLSVSSSRLFVVNSTPRSGQMLTYISSFIVALHWAIEIRRIESKDGLDTIFTSCGMSRASVSLPLFVFCTSIFSFIHGLYLLYNDNDTNAPMNAAAGIKSLSNAIKYTATLLPPLLPISCLIFGPWSPLFLLVICIQVITLIIIGTCAYNQLQIKSKSAQLFAAGIAGIWALWVTTIWSATGHSASLAALNYPVAFLGDPTGFSKVRGGILLVTHTFVISHLLIGGPLLTRIAMAAVNTAILSRRCDGDDDGGDGDDNDGGNIRLAGVTYHALSRALIAAFIAPLTAVTLLCFLEPRHLMTWAVFAPKFIFEFCGAMVRLIAFIVPLWWW